MPGISRGGIGILPDGICPGQGMGYWPGIMAYGCIIFAHRMMGHRPGIPCITGQVPGMLYIPCPGIIPCTGDTGIIPG